MLLSFRTIVADNLHNTSKCIIIIIIIIILATNYRAGCSKPRKGETFRIRPDRPWGPPILLYKGYRVSFPGIKRPGRGVDHPTPSTAEVKKEELRLYSPSVPSWPVTEQNLHFIIIIIIIIAYVTSLNLSTEILRIPATSATINLPEKNVIYE